jgi:WD40 repeat protein
VLPRHVFEAARADGKEARMLLPAALRALFRPHVGPVNGLDASPFHRNAFLSCGADGALRLSSLLEREPALELRPAGAAGGVQQGDAGGTLCCTQWSPHRPAVFAAASAAGDLFVFDLAQSHASPVAVLPAGGDKHRAVLAIAFNIKTRGLVAAGDSQGDLRVFRLGWRLANRQAADKAALDLALLQGAGAV